MLVNDILEQIKAKYGIEYNYSSIHGVQEFHIFKGEIEVINGLTLPEDDNAWYITFYHDEVILDSYAIINNTFKRLLPSSILELSMTDTQTKQLIEDYLDDKSEYIKKVNEKLKWCEDLYNTIGKSNLPEQKKIDVLNKQIAVEREFEIVEEDKIFDLEEFNGSQNC